MGDFAGCFALLLHLEGLQALDFHHEVESLLLIDPVLLKSFLLLLLPVTDSDYFGVEHHLVHVFDIVVLFVEHLLGLGQQGVVLVRLSLLVFSLGNFGLTSLVHLKHAGFASLSLVTVGVTYLGGGHLLIFLLSQQSALLNLLFLSLNLGTALDAVELVLGKDNGVALLAGLALAANGAQLVLREHSCACGALRALVFVVACNG